MSLFNHSLNFLSEGKTIDIESASLETGGCRVSSQIVPCVTLQFCIGYAGLGVPTDLGESAAGAGGKGRESIIVIPFYPYSLINDGNYTDSRLVIASHVNPDWEITNGVFVSCAVGIYLSVSVYLSVCPYMLVCM